MEASNEEVIFLARLFTSNVSIGSRVQDSCLSSPHYRIIPNKSNICKNISTLPLCKNVVRFLSRFYFYLVSRIYWSLLIFFFLIFNVGLTDTELNVKEQNQISGNSWNPSLDTMSISFSEAVSSVTCPSATSNQLDYFWSYIKYFRTYYNIKYPSGRETAGIIQRQAISTPEVLLRLNICQCLILYRGRSYFNNNIFWITMTIA